MFVGQKKTRNGLMRGKEEILREVGSIKGNKHNRSRRRRQIRKETNQSRKRSCWRAVGKGSK